MRNHKCYFWQIVAVTSVLAATMASAESTTVSYQGTLRLTGGAPVADANYPLTFSVWDAFEGGNKLWEEAHPAVLTKDGLFSVQLGLSVLFGTVFANNSAVWLEIVADTGAGPEIYTPRVAMASAPYAQQALNANTVGGVSAAGLASQMDGKVSAHNGSGAAHSDIRSQITNDISTHNSAAAAHPALQMPAAAMMQYAGTTAPSGWLLCNGAGVSTTTYAALFAVIGYTYGGSGTTFNLPNLSGKVPVGKDTGQTEFLTLGQQGGAKTHTLGIAEMPAHSHSLNQSAYNGGGNQTPPGSNPFTYANNANTNSTGGGGAHNNLQPYIVLNYIIKY